MATLVIAVCIVLCVSVALVVWAALVLGARADDQQPGLREHEAQLQAQAIADHRARRWRA